MNIHEIFFPCLPKLFCKFISSSISLVYSDMVCGAVASLSVPFVWYLFEISFITYEISKLEAAV